MRDLGELERRMIQLGNWLLALVCGSMGVFTLWFCLLNVALISYAVGFLAIAILLDVANRYFFAADPPSGRSR